MEAEASTKANTNDATGTWESPQRCVLLLIKKPVLPLYQFMHQWKSTESMPLIILDQLLIHYFTNGMLVFYCRRNITRSMRPGTCLLLIPRLHRLAL